MSESSDDFRLPIRATLGDIYRFLWTARRDLVLMAAIPVVGLTIYQVAMTDIFGVIDPAEPSPTGEPATLLGVLILNVPSLLLYTMFAVAWHRRYLMRGESTTVYSALKWDGRKMRFLLRTILITLIAAAVVAVPIVMLTIFGVVLNFAAAADVSPPVDVKTLSSIIGIASAIMILVIYLRLSLWLPATATDAPFSLLESWRLGRGNSWRLFVITCGAEFALWISAVLLHLAIDDLQAHSVTLDLVIELITNTLAYGILAAGIAALSICYDRLLARIANDPMYSGMPFMDD